MPCRAHSVPPTPGTDYHSAVASADRRTRRTRLTRVGQVAAVALAVLLPAACTSSTAKTTPAKRPTAVSASPAPSVTPSPTRATAAPLGNPGTFPVGQQQVTFTEPAHTSAGQAIGPRTLVTQVDYPLAASSAAQPAPGPLPLIVFGPGFQECVSTYGELLRTWASAGYVVAGVTFPRTNCQLGGAAGEADLVNQPADMSYVISAMLELSEQPHDVVSGLLNGQQIAVAGQSDGGDTVAAMAANTCCADHRLKAAAVLSGAEWPAMPGRYFTAAAPPMLFTQGNADTINPPSASLLLYGSDEAGLRYYLNLSGASHMVPYAGTNPVERLVARVTLAFFNRYVLGQAGALATLAQQGNAAGAALVSGGHVPSDAG